MAALTEAGAGCGPDRRPTEPATPPPATAGAADQARVLVFTRTAGFRHPSIEDGVAAIRLLGRRHGFAVEHVYDY